jgi:hypothetical protein
MEVSVGEHVIKKKDQDPSILVDVDCNRRVIAEGAVKVKVFGEELRHRLEGQTFFLRWAEGYNKDRVGRILF